jgi:xanthine dehydrogenase YagT iron-sulfur-binding subunit
VLREKLGLTAAKEGCGRGECGACTVLVDGGPRYACLMLAAESGDVELTTLEGLMAGEELGPTQQAFAEADAFQCGYCTSGVSGNLCRCGAYENIFRAVAAAASHRGEEGPS